MESATAAVRGSASLARARSALVLREARGARGRGVVGAGHGLAVRARRRALVAVAVASSHHENLEPLPSQKGGGAVAMATQTQADEAEVHVSDAAVAAVAQEEEEETSSPQLAPGETVRVRFVLQKQWSIDQSVCLVGGDPALGLWDPLNAFALKRAEESHDWILEKDLPANKLIEFKFLLQDSAGKLRWQDGPNRRFETGETANTLVVLEDWDDVKNQKIAEEEGVVSTGTEQSVVSDDSESSKDTVLEDDDELQVDDDQVKEDESIVAEEDKKKAAVGTDASVQVDWVKTNEAYPQTSMLHEGTEVLDKFLGKENMENNSILSTDENYVEKLGVDNILDGVAVENVLATAYEHDLLWGWKALQQLLMSLGFKMDTT